MGVMTRMDSQVQSSATKFDSVENDSTDIDSQCLRVVLIANKLAEKELNAISPTISEARQAFAKINWTCEFVLLVPRAEHQAKLVETFSRSVDHVVCGNLSDAFTLDSKIVSNRLAVIDTDIALDEVQWQWLFRNGQDADIACCYSNRPVRGKWLTRLTQALGSIVSRLILKTGKNSFRPGIVIFDLTKTQTLLTDGLAIKSPEELIAICRHDGQTVFEAATKVSEARVATPIKFSEALAIHSQNIKFWWSNIAFPKSAVVDDSQVRLAPGRPDALDGWSARTRWLAASLLVAVAALILFTRLGYPFFEPDEARNAQLALNICKSGDWMTLTLGDELYWDKPPLQAWMTAACYRLLGPSEFATRLPCAIASFLTVILVMLLGGRLFGFRAGLFGATLLLLCSGFSIASRYVTMDASLTLFATAMLFSTILGVRNKTISRPWLVVAGLACGLGFMTKGPVIAVLVLPPVLAAGWLEKNEFFNSPRFWLYPGVAAFLISAPWFLATGIVHPDFLTYFFWEHNVVRFSDAFVHKQPWWFYIPVILVAMYPISFLLPSFAKWVKSTSRYERRSLGNEFGALLLYALWVIAFFSLSESKLPTYILPAVPVICLLLGKMLDIAALAKQPIGKSGTWNKSIPRHMAISVSILFVVFACLLIFVFSMRDPIVIATLATASLVLIALVACSRLPNIRAAWAAALATAMMFTLLAVTEMLPSIAEMRSVQVAASRLSDSPPFKNLPIVFVGRPPYAYSFCLSEKTIYHFGHHAEAIAFLRDNPDTILVASKDDIKKLQKKMNGAICFENKGGHRKLYTSHLRFPIDARSASRQLPINSGRQAQLPSLLR